jgi:hypothetical protein
MANSYKNLRRLLRTTYLKRLSVCQSHYNLDSLLYRDIQDQNRCRNNDGKLQALRVVRCDALVPRSSARLRYILHVTALLPAKSYPLNPRFAPLKAAHIKPRPAQHCVQRSLNG